MPDAVVAAPAAAGGAPPAGRVTSSFLASAARMAVFWMFLSWIRNMSSPTQSKTAVEMVGPRFPKGSPVDISFYLDETPVRRQFQPDELVWQQLNVPLAMGPELQHTFTYYPSKSVQNNGSVFLHVKLTPGSQFEYHGELEMTYVHPLTVNLARPKNKTGHSLLSESKPSRGLEAVAADTPREILNYWKPNMTINLVDHFSQYTRGGIPAPIMSSIIVDPHDNKYRPVLYFSEFWMLRDNLIIMNDTVESVNLTLYLTPMSMWYWQLQMQMDKSFDMQVSTGMSQEGESDDIKRIFIEGNPYLLGLTMVVSLLHTVFDLLAFKNDIGFWKNNKSMEGLSARSVLINAGCQLVILLYLLDNETSMVVLFSSFLGTAIEFWKVTKAMNVTFDRTRFPFIRIADRASYSHNLTKQYDAEAMQYLSYVLYPLVLGYAIYSLVYSTHKSWYSWILTSLVGAVYMFGFILMCPQLYLNYRLKSVAHLPWRQMTYKFLNTIIDDLFAFVIKMPTLHRLSVFRDDLVFLVFIYQRWVYRVDKTRVNEFGFSGVEPTAEEAAPVEQITEGQEASPLQNLAKALGEPAEGEESTLRRRREASESDTVPPEEQTTGSSDAKKEK